MGHGWLAALGSHATHQEDRYGDEWFGKNVAIARRPLERAATPKQLPTAIALRSTPMLAVPQQGEQPSDGIDRRPLA
jgi:hypothetical protein